MALSDAARTALLAPYMDDRRNMISKPPLTILAKLGNAHGIIARIRQHLSDDGSALLLAKAKQAVMLADTEARKASELKKARNRKGGSQRAAFAAAGW